MKKILKMLLFLFFCYYLMQFLFDFFGKGYEITYSLKTDNGSDATIVEKRVKNTKGEISSYTFLITIDGISYDLELLTDFGYTDKVITAINYYNSDMKCIYPTFKSNKQLTDVICNDGGVIRHYNDLKGTNASLDEFVSKLTNYDSKKYNNILENIYNSKNITVYKSNIVDGHYLAINDYHGLYTISTKNTNKVEQINIFKNDEYEKKLNALVGKYYVSADYDSDYDFNKFVLVDMTNNKIDYINMTTTISFDSYIQGVVGDSLYIFDKNNKIQYQFNVKKKTLTKVGNVENQIKYYNNGVWSRVSAYEAINNEIKFNYYEQINKDGYAKVIKIGGNQTGYYYYFKKNGTNYDVYRSSVKNSNLLTYMFKTSDINNISFIGKYIYYNIGNTFKYYSDLTGNRTIYKNSEYQFNKTLKYYVYEE